MIEHLTAAIDRWHTEKGKSPGAIHLERHEADSVSRELRGHGLTNEERERPVAFLVAGVPVVLVTFYVEVPAISNEQAAFGRLQAEGPTLARVPAEKHDDGKPRCDLLPPAALLRVADVLGFGARKYAPHAWREVPDGHRRYLAAALRHVFARMRGERLDPESGLPHLAHAACCLLFALELDE